MMYTDKDVWHILYPEHKAIEDTDASARIKTSQGNALWSQIPHQERPDLDKR